MLTDQLTDEQVIQVEKILGRALFKVGDKVRYTGPFDSRGVGPLACEPPEFGVVRGVIVRGRFSLDYVAVEFCVPFKGGHSCATEGLEIETGRGAFVNSWQLQHVLPEEWPEETE